MLYHEFNMDKALAVRYEEGRDEGMEEGEVRGIEKERSYIKSLLEQGLSGEEFLKQMKVKYAVP
jgi:hypothetical protein